MCAFWAELRKTKHWFIGVYGYECYLHHECFYHPKVVGWKNDSKDLNKVIYEKNIIRHYDYCYNELRKG